MSLALPEFRIEVYLGRWEFAGRHYLCGSDAESLTLSELLALADDGEREAFDSLPLMYTPTWGTDRLRRAIATTYDAVDADHALTFAGAEEAILWALQELVGAGDHAVVAVPGYQSTESVALATGAAVSPLVLDAAAGWALDLDALQALLRPNTRLVAVNFPHNPTGAMPDPATFRALVELCDERGIRLLSDEVYRGVELDPRRTLPQAADLSETALSLNVMSKAYGLPGLRIGWIACRDRALLERLERRKHYGSICNAGPSELLAAIALRNGEAIRARVREIIAANLDTYDAFFARHREHFEYAPPQGGCVCFPRYLGAATADGFCRALVEQAGVVLLPGSMMGSALTDTGHDRFRLGVARKDPQPGLEALEQFLAGAGR